MRQQSFTYIHALATISVALLCFYYIDRMNKGTQRVIMTNQQMMENENNFSAAETTRMIAEQSSAVIVLLVHRNTKMNDLCLSMRTLKNIKGSLTAPVHIFHLGHLQDRVRQENQRYLQACTDRDVYENVIDTANFPIGFVKEEGKDYFSSHIARFWTTQIWDHPAMEPYEIIMRIDDDVCFSLSNWDLPSFKSPHNVYFSHNFPGTVEVSRGNFDAMYEFSHDYLVEHELVVGHETLWQIIDFTHKETGSLPNFVNSFEVVRKSFMLRSDVYAWHYALTEMPPYGYFDSGWTTSAERFLTMAIFGTPSSVDDSMVPGFLQKNLAAGVTHHKVCTLPFVE